jgi:UDP-N-acetylmuramyl tripeptide synthase
MGARLSLETSAARLVGRLSRAAGRGGGTTLPGKLVWKLDPGALDALAAVLPEGIALVSGTNGKTTTTAMASAILSPGRRLAWNHSGANLASGVTSTLLTAREADLGLLEVDEFVLPEVMRRTKPHAVCLANLFRDQLDRYGELEHIAERWRDAVGALDADATVVANADDPLVASLAAGRTRRMLFGLDDVRRAREALQHASDSKYCVRCGRPYQYDAAYVGHLGAYRCPTCGHARPAPDVTAREIEPDGLRGVGFTLATESAEARVRLAVPGLYNVYNALAAASLALALGVGLDEVVDGLHAFRPAFGRFERFTAGDRGVLLLLVKNPAGANEALRTLEDGGIPETLVVALNDGIADGRDVSWIWDVDFEPVLDQAGRIVVTGERAAELGLRFTYAGFPRERLEIVGDLEAALDRGLALTPPGGELTVLPTYTAMLRLRAIATERGLTRPYWERDGQP